MQSQSKTNAATQEIHQMCCSRMNWWLCRNMMESGINIPPAIDSKVQKCTLDDKV